MGAGGLWLVLAGALAIAATGCSESRPPSEPPGPLYASGSRLKIRVQRAGDVHRFHAAYDNELDVECAAGLASDGSLRCLPVTDATVAFSDAACTEEVAILYDEACPVGARSDFAHIEEPSEDGCSRNARTRIHRIGEVISSPSLFKRGTNGTCSASSSVAGTVHQLELELAPAAMALLELEQRPRGDALTVPYVVSEGGFYLLSGRPRDVEHDVDCSARTVGSTLVCAPVAYGDLAAYSDAACSKPGLFLDIEPDCGVPSAGIGVLPLDECNDEAHAFYVAEQVTSGHVDSEEGCTEQTDVPASLFAFGEQIPDSALPALEMVEQGTGRIRLQATHAAGEPVTKSDNFTVDGAGCAAVAFSDGRLRCRPHGMTPASDNLFRDDACTRRLVRMSSQSCIPTPTLAYRSAGNCLVAAIFEIGAVYEGPVYLGDGDGGCEPFEASDDELRELGDGVPNERFGEVTIDTL